MSPHATKSDVEREMEKAMGPDHSREGMFVYHNCYRCDDGKKPCVQGGPHRCEYPHARND
jgi:hypothetical protein